MNGRRAVVGLSLLCVLVVSVAVAPNAVALKHTTAYTCLEEPKPGEKTPGFEDEHCTKAATGAKVKWVHKAIPAKTTTALKVSNNETMSKPIAAKLKATAFKVPFELEAGGFQSCNNGAEKTDIQNEEGTEVTPPRAAGFFCGEFFNVVVNKPAKCQVAKEAVILNYGHFVSIVNVNGSDEEMWVQFTPKEGKPFATFEFTGAECALKGKLVEVKGFARGNVQTEKETQLLGATLKFTTAETSHSLEVGGVVAEFEGTFTPRMLPEVGVPESPIALTTDLII